MHEGIWQPIETAPKDGTYIDVWAGKSRYVNAFWFDPATDKRWDGVLAGWIFEEDGYEYIFFEPTHWMPLPDPPETMKGKP